MYLKSLFVFFMLSACCNQALADNDVSAELAAQNTPEGWTAVQLPNLPAITASNTFNIKDYGAETTSGDNASAIQAAINAVPSTGGMVVVPAGTWKCGPIVVKSKMIVHLEAGATLKLLPFAGVGVNSAGCYPLGSKNSSGKYNYEIFLSSGSNTVNDLIIEGEGDTSVIDGQGAGWWSHRDELGTRPALIRIKKGSRHLFRNFKMLNSPGTNLTLGQSGSASHMTVHNVTIKAPSSEAANPSHNTDGIPVWGPYANIYDCNISTGDDNIVCDSKAHHVHAWNIACGDGHGMSMGSFTEGLHDIIYEDITFTNTGSGFRLKTNTGRSGNDQTGTNGAVKNIICRNATMTGCPSPIKITCWYDSDLQNPADNATGSVEEKTPEFYNILFQNITANGVAGKTNWKHNSPVYLYGRPEMKIHDVVFDNVQISSYRGMFLAFCNDIIFKNGCKVTNLASPSKPVAVSYQADTKGTYDGSPNEYDTAIGQVVKPHETSSPSFNLLGQTVSPSSNNIVVVNGKKIINAK